MIIGSCKRLYRLLFDMTYLNHKISEKIEYGISYIVQFCISNNILIETQIFVQLFCIYNIFHFTITATIFFSTKKKFTFPCVSRCTTDQCGYNFGKFCVSFSFITAYYFLWPCRVVVFLLWTNIHNNETLTAAASSIVC